MDWSSFFLDDPMLENGKTPGFRYTLTSRTIHEQKSAIEATKDELTIKQYEKRNSSLKQINSLLINRVKQLNQRESALSSQISELLKRKQELIKNMKIFSFAEQSKSIDISAINCTKLQNINTSCEQEESLLIQNINQSNYLERRTDGNKKICQNFSSHLPIVLVNKKRQTRKFKD